jgi:prevent-host-death family protein
MTHVGGEMKNKKVFGQTLSVTELSQNASGAIKRVQTEDEPIIIMKNNKPVAVLMDIKLFNYLDGIAEEQYWEKVILERIANDDGVRFTHEEVFGKPQPKPESNKRAKK